MQEEVKMGFKFNFFLTVFPEILPFLKITLFLAITAYLLALVLAIIISVCRTFKIKGINKFLDLYISLFRSTPIVTQLFFIYFGIPQIIPAFGMIDEMIILIIVLALNEAAYMAEVIRGAFLSIPRGQYDAAKSIGMTTRETLQHIVIPQAIRIALPGLVNSIISLTKGTSIGYTIGVLEMLTASQLYGARTYRTIEVYVAVLLIYWAIVLIMTRFQSGVENRLNRRYA